MPSDLKGVYSAVITPIRADLSPDLERFVAHGKWLLQAGCDGLAVLGTTGEANSFSLSERKALVEGAIAGGIPAQKLMPGTGVNAIPETVELTRHAVEAGCRAVVMLPPNYYKNPSEDGLFAAYSEVIERVGDSRLRILLYHFPRMSQIPITAPLIERLIKRYPTTVIGMKDSSGDLEHALGMIERFPGFAVFAGADPLMISTLRKGGAGCITATSNLIAAELAFVYRHHADPARAAEVEAMQKRITEMRALFMRLPQIPATKAAVGLVRGESGWERVRPPLTPLDADQMRDLEASFRGISAAVA